MPYHYGAQTNDPIIIGDKIQAVESNISTGYAKPNHFRMTKVQDYKNFLRTQFTKMLNKLCRFHHKKLFYFQNSLSCNEFYYGRNKLYSIKTNGLLHKLNNFCCNGFDV